jgi:hypothetical protein
VGERLWLLEDGEVGTVSPVDRSVTDRMAVDGSKIVAGGDMRTAAAAVGGGGRWSLLTNRGDDLGIGALGVGKGSRRSSKSCSE